MVEKIYLHFLILCGILCEGIIAKLSDEDTRESSDFLVRKRRVINHLPYGLELTPIEQANYMVNIKENNRAHCAGVILSHYTVLTAAACITLPVSHYHVWAGATYENRGKLHTVITKDAHHGNPPHDMFDGISLITVDPPLEYTLRVGNIHFYTGPLESGTLVTVRGWGCSYPPQPYPQKVQRALRSITLPIIDRGQCRNVYQGHFNVTEKYICTYDLRQYCARTDAGAPLLVNNQLVGIHVYKGEYFQHRNPDVYINLQREEYSTWIRDNAILM